MSEVTQPVQPAALPPENYLSDSRRSAIVSSFKSRIASAREVLERGVSRRLKKMYADLLKTGNAKANALATKIGAEMKKAEVSRKQKVALHDEYVKAEKAAHEVYAKAISAAKKKFDDKCVIIDKSLKESSNVVGDLEADLHEMGWAYDTSLRGKVIRPLFNSDSGNNRILGGLLARPEKEAMEKKFDALAAVMEDVEIAIHVNGTSLNERLEQFQAAVEEIVQA